MAGPPPQIARARTAVRAALLQRLTDLADRTDHALHDDQADASARIIVGLSGGADSTALLATAVWCARKLGLSTHAVIIDHGLADDSASVAERARTTAERVGADQVTVRRVQVDRDAPGGVEQSARTARLDALDEIADATGALAVLLGHTLDDQAEQVLLGLARGSGARSLAGIPRERGRILRPFLGTGRDETTGLWRKDTRAICDQLDLDIWDDPMNEDQDLLRVAVRTAALPQLQEVLGEHVTSALVRTADLLRDDADVLDDLAAEEFTAARRHPSAEDPDGTVLALSATALAPLARALRTRVLKLAAVEAARLGGHPSDKSILRRQVLAADSLLSAYRGQGPIPLPGRIDVHRSNGAILFVTTHPAATQRRPS
ncbi:tRNA lysidine(34) synthetase TilS [Helcobacillus massiliensis]|uniref:tRNA lysidine(34) synthetase TilS n=1 Tax=Helcobacillus massiliensis TaxID=521392 RepID=UPI0025523520|nr:tRNA lysidine(34) synthetase TilS [Helcobacillus massiliensis]MDK7742354.1 tRNA lysidine(34) synthetase TilS [Helcobacillus massiliensis]WOO92010.1 tRNA lysidine(34) synthetase TilS [Helcobacillus massiliensis]